MMAVRMIRNTSAARQVADIGRRSARSHTPSIKQTFQKTATRALSFSFSGPKKLDDVVKKELLESKSEVEVKDIWLTYHENKDRPGVLGLVWDGAKGKTVLARANNCPFFVQPVFREDGFFMMVSQFQTPAYFLMAYLEDYKMDPHAATPLLTFTIFDDYAESKNLALVRCEIQNKSITDEEGRKIVTSVLENYSEDMSFGIVRAFNERPDSFDIDDYISQMRERWKTDPPSVST